jgi:hypothetical protein
MQCIFTNLTDEGMSVFPKLYAVTSVMNPQRYASRYRLYWDFEKHMRDSGVTLLTVECQLGDRPFVVTQSDNPLHCQVRTRSEIWHKENLLNLAINRLPLDWEYVAWVDSDIYFTRPDWAAETVHQLQHNKIVQMFSHARDLGPKYEPLVAHTGFVYNLRKGSKPNQNYSNWHPGFAWAARKQTLNDLGCLIDWAILGAADRHMACGLIGKMNDSLPPELPTRCANYYNWLIGWQDRASKYIDGDVGYVDGLLLHGWHGNKRDRGYVDRWQILLEEEYDPLLDLKRDWQGVWQLTDHSPSMRDKIRAYFRQRNEDSVDVVA